MTPPIVVHPPSASGERRVTAHTELLGLARSAQDVFALLLGVGLKEQEIQLDDPALIEWRGGGPEEWRPAPGG
ncbi:hypothetical protein [Streptomyces boncukensis]|uniref:Uncharacterized protein n=1 Tax=Streptomyces boncukensis TaxID=2711219 RepID=A0A6G4X4H3_9ACTN|nr:hypothetical protein [Streptomyces boncukensis]NGO71780.1 hypothetical protein [Streptomyces boncukensis]